MLSEECRAEFLDCKCVPNSYLSLSLNKRVLCCALCSVLVHSLHCTALHVPLVVRVSCPPLGSDGRTGRPQLLLYAQFCRAHGNAAQRNATRRRIYRIINQRLIDTDFHRRKQFIHYLRVARLLSPEQLVQCSSQSTRTSRVLDALLEDTTGYTPHPNPNPSRVVSRHVLSEGPFKVRGRNNKSTV